MKKVYTYARCSTCRKATAWLREHGVEFEELPIRETPPQAREILEMKKSCGGEWKKLLNTSSQDYREAGLKDRLETLSEKEICALLQENGNLVKRPFVIGDGVALAGFKPDLWESELLK